MATSSARKPLPALAFLLALSLLTALVWWRVIHRSDSAKTASQPSCSASPTPTVNAVPAPQAVTVVVLNSTDKTGLAAQVTGFLTTDGFKTGKPDNDTTSRAPVTGVAEIRFGTAGAAGAKLLTFYVPGATLVPDSTKTDASIDLAVGAKYTAVASTADVAKALAAAKVSQLPAPSAAGSSVAPAPAGSSAASGATSPKPSGSTAAGSSTGTAKSSSGAKSSTSATKSAC